jgi:hypothetical protein
MNTQLIYYIAMYAQPKYYILGDAQLIYYFWINAQISLSLFLSLSLTHTHSLSLFFCVSLSMSLSLYLSHTLSLSFSPTTYIILYYIDINVRKVILASSNLRARHFCRLFQDYLPASYYILMCVK